MGDGIAGHLARMTSTSWTLATFVKSRTESLRHLQEVANPERTSMEAYLLDYNHQYFMRTAALRGQHGYTKHFHTAISQETGSERTAERCATGGSCWRVSHCSRVVVSSADAYST